MDEAIDKWFPMQCGFWATYLSYLQANHTYAVKDENKSYNGTYNLEGKQKPN